MKSQCAKMTTKTPMTPELFHLGKKKKREERDANLAAQQAERTMNIWLHEVHPLSFSGHSHVILMFALSEFMS